MLYSPKGLCSTEKHQSKVCFVVITRETRETVPSFVLFPVRSPQGCVLGTGTEGRRVQEQMAAEDTVTGVSRTVLYTDTHVCVTLYFP